MPEKELLWWTSKYHFLKAVHVSVDFALADQNWKAE